MASCIEERLIASCIEQRLRRDKLGVIEELSGHGVGHRVHEDPLILNYGKPGRGDLSSPGIECKPQAAGTENQRNECDLSLPERPMPAGEPKSKSFAYQN